MPLIFKILPFVLLLKESASLPVQTNVPPSVNCFFLSLYFGSNGTHDGPSFAVNLPLLLKSPAIPLEKFTFHCLNTSLKFVIFHSFNLSKFDVEILKFIFILIFFNINSIYS